LSVSDFPTTLIQLRGKPRLGSEDPEVRAVLEKYGCPRDIAYRVVRTLEAFNAKQTRVMLNVDIDALRADLAPLEIGVEKLGD
jgi:hypothetical protein